MSIVIWFTVALALWHFTIFVPDRFWQGIIGALIGCVVGGMISGAIVELILGNGLADTDLITFLAAVPGTALGAWVVYRIGVRQGTEPIEDSPTTEKV
ncbi:MAG: hypothetical protein KDB66_02090 [Solirubrobacterales bacterium]|nr:hypothetical protein [Solirubrobacterales bacterium]MCB8915327.1 hypothetical protein [Thermoleophilales bacterium]